MIDYQHQILHGATYWSFSTSLSLFAIGALFNLQGYRFARFLFGVAAGVAAFVIGVVLGRVLNLPPTMTGVALGVVVATAALLRLSFGVTACSMLTLGFYGGYLAMRMGFSDPNVLIAAGIGTFSGGALAWAGQRSLPILISTLQGAGLMIVGFVGLASGFAPTFASTFVAWASDLSLFVPLLVAMLVTLGYSVQANMQQGDIRSGSAGATDWKARDATA